MPTAIAAADFDGNGGIDLAVSADSFNLWILFNDGNGVFEGGGSDQGVATGSSSEGLAAADLDGDGDVDIATFNDSTDDVSVLLNNGNGSFAAPRRYPGTENPVDITAADLNGDGDIDLAVADGVTNDVVRLINQGEGQARFVESQTYRIGVTPNAITAGDLDRDGDLDLALVPGDPGAPSVLYNGEFPP